MGGPSQPSHGRHAVWSVENDPGRTSAYPAGLSALPSALPTRGGRTLGVTTRRMWPWRVIALIGKFRFRDHRSVPQMHQALQARGISIAQRSVTHLMQRYEELVTLRITDQERIKARLQKQGHVILALHGLQPDVGHQVLWVVRDCLCEPKKSSWRAPCSAVHKEI